MAKELLKLGIPAGSLKKGTVGLFEKAGFSITEAGRSYMPRIDDEQVRLVCLRAQEMSRYVADGVLDAGLTGYDWITENDSDVIEVCELIYSKDTGGPARWVLAVPNESPVVKPEDLQGGIVATELVNATAKYFAAKNVDVKVEFSWGATEAKARLVDAIVELTETGSSLEANNLRVVDTVITSTTRLIANKTAWRDKFKRSKTESIALLLKAALAARHLVGLKMNVMKDDLDKILKLLPAEKSPTVSSLADPRYAAIEVVVSDKVERTLVPALNRAGASGIITYPLNKVIH
jgi:ATP phosphoribosyltransferase